MKTVEVYALCMVATVVSFLGFVVENIWLACVKGYIDNRNMCLPFLLGYGLGMIAIYLMFGTPTRAVFFGKKMVFNSRFTRNLFYFVAVMLCVSVGEIALGTFVEKTCHIVWWDYSKVPMNITRYTTIPTSMAFAVLITIFMQRFFDPLMKAFMRMDYENLRGIAIVCMTVMIVDFLYNAINIYNANELVPMWRISTKGTKAYMLLHS